MWGSRAISLGVHLHRSLCEQMKKPLMNYLAVEEIINHRQLQLNTRRASLRGHKLSKVSSSSDHPSVLFRNLVFSSFQM